MAVKQTIQIRKNLQAKKVSLFRSVEANVVAVYLKPGDKVKYYPNDFDDLYLDKFGETPYKKVYYNGKPCFIVKEALDFTKKGKVVK